MTYGSRNIRPAKPSPGVACSPAFLPHFGQVWQELAPLRHLGHRPPFLKQRAGRAHVHALATAGAGWGRTPRLVQVGDDLGLDAAAHYVPGVRALDAVANAYTTSAEDAAVVVDREALVTGINVQRRIAVRIAHMGDFELLGERLHFAVPVRNTDRADVVALGKE